MKNMIIPAKVSSIVFTAYFQPGCRFANLQLNCQLTFSPMSLKIVAKKSLKSSLKKSLKNLLKKLAKKTRVLKKHAKSRNSR